MLDKEKRKRSITEYVAKPRKSGSNRPSYSVKTKSFELQPKKLTQNEKPSFRLINKGVLAAFLEENFMSIVKKAKNIGPESHLSWLFE